MCLCVLFETDRVTLYGVFMFWVLLFFCVLFMLMRLCVVCGLLRVVVWCVFRVWVVCVLASVIMRLCVLFVIYCVMWCDSFWGCFVCACVCVCALFV